MYPLPDDRIALARMEWCRAGSSTEQEPLSCIIRAFMCKNHINGIENSTWGSSSKPFLDRQLVSGKITKEGNAHGVCGLLTANRLNNDLWKNYGLNREVENYKTINSQHPYLNYTLADKGINLK